MSAAVAAHAPARPLLPSCYRIAPMIGQTVRLADAAGPEFHGQQAIRIRLTARPEVSSVDILNGHTASTAAWVLLTGWQVDAKGRHVGRLHSHLPARRVGIEVVRPCD